jgi:Mlc titration factor MtfA (ptsG expression regulator)
LDEKWQEVFIERCLFFTKNKNIRGAEGFKPTNKVKAIIAASAIQLSLGLDHWQLDYFDTIIIHPNDFEDHLTGQKFRGETNLAGYIQFSWRHFISGYRVKNDNINLGLHEFAHALRFNPIRGSDQDHFMEHYFNAWLASANEAFSDIRQNRETIFRKYGGTNINEFLSVCIEHFFESPEQIKERYPMLYYSTAILLNQETNGVKTQINVRERLFNEKNKLVRFKHRIDLKTLWHKTKSFQIIVAIIIPLIYTLFVTGPFSGGSFFLSALLMGMLLRYDFYYINVSVEETKLFIRKGYMVFKRREIQIDISQLISVRVYGNHTGDSEVELIYYDQKENGFYMETISTGVDVSDEILKEAIQNKIAVFKN